MKAKGDYGVARIPARYGSLVQVHHLVYPIQMISSAKEWCCDIDGCGRPTMTALGDSVVGEDMQWQLELEYWQQGWGSEMDLRLQLSRQAFAEVFVSGAERGWRAIVLIRI
jgi:hypothetical protein